jgi:hypothetical protein
MTSRRVLTWARDKDQANKRRDSHREDHPDDDTIEAEQVDGRWAVTAAKTKKEDRA